ncbi:glycosyl hydrolase family 28-related protein [Thalassoroseus pseudoceratinae]|uniref:glycosyl hydrolase family 28-related protein n=1 Tax=Thalassoroseus pseudoceratinae TaxID=2713176 RepID=UPI001420A506|nr:glycosyl hydrolase family 28-related protein [Thalassoroseus pseudoceratinae]
MTRWSLGGILLALLVFHAASGELVAQTSLWGRTGEKWDPKGPLPDFSFAGYQRSEQPIPERTPTVSVTDYGAQPGIDATKAFQEAIEKNPGQCIGVPAGRFVLSDRLRIQTAGTVLQGEGSRQTTLFFTRSLQEIEPTQTQTGGGQATTKYSWSGGLITVGGWGVASAKKQPISGTAERGDTEVQVANLQDVQVGDDVQLKMTDDDAGSLTDYLYRGDSGDDKTVRGKLSIVQVARVTAVSGDRVTLDRPLRADINPRWQPTLTKFQPRTQNSGLEGVSIEFPVTPYGGHFKEVGFNGIDLIGTNNWVRDVEILNCDSGIFIHGQFHTVTDVTIRSDRQPDREGRTGHHGFTAAGQDCLVTKFRIRTRFIHDVTVTRGSVGNVFSEGNGVDLCFDFHREAPYENLFTQISLGKASRPWNSGGTRGKGRHAGTGNVFWNIDSRTKITPPKPDFGPAGLLFVGLNAYDGGVKKPVTLPNGWYYEPQTPGRFAPANLHQAQVERRLKSVSPRD